MRAKRGVLDLVNSYVVVNDGRRTYGGGDGLGTHEPPVQTARILAQALGVPLAYLYCDDDRVAALLLQLYELNAVALRRVLDQAMTLVAQARREA